MTTLYIDTEFNSYRGALISMGLVAETGAFWYRALHCPTPDPRVAEHVMPVLATEPVGLNRFQKGLEEFLATFDSVHIVADWPEDIQHFCWALITGPGTRINTPPLTMEVRRDIDSATSAIPHNALADAVAVMDSAEAKDSAK